MKTKAEMEDLVRSQLELGIVSFWAKESCINWYDFQAEQEFWVCAKLDKCYSGYLEWFNATNGYYPSPSEKTLNTIKLVDAYTKPFDLAVAKDSDDPLTEEVVEKDPNFFEAGYFSLVFYNIQRVKKDNELRATQTLQI